MGNQVSMVIDLDLFAKSVAFATVLIAAPAGRSDELYNTHCIACHGANGEGIDGLGIALVQSPYIERVNEADLIEFLKQGRMPNDPETVSGRPMPGFAWLPQDDLATIASYIKTL